MSAAQAGMRRHHAVRLLLKEKGGKTMELSRLDFSRKFLQKELRFVPAQVNYILTLPYGKGFDVSFAGASFLREFWGKLQNAQNTQGSLAAMFEVIKLTDNSIKTVIVRMYNETVQPEDVAVWLGRYCNVKGPLTQVKDPDGIWTGAWRVTVQQREDPVGYGGLKAIPSTIVLGENRGHVHYQDQPKLCRKCGEHGHLAGACDKVVCMKCREVGHRYEDCTNGRSCNLCGERSHLIRSCPSSWANKVRAGGMEAAAADRASERQREKVAVATVAVVEEEVVAVVEEVVAVVEEVAGEVEGAEGAVVEEVGGEAKTLPTPIPLPQTEVTPEGERAEKDGLGELEREPVCPVRGLAIGEPTTVWRNVAHPALLNWHRDLSWMVAHEILPVGAVMHSRGMARTSACPRPGCGQEESVRHLLWECRAARDLWKEAGPLISPRLPAGEDLTPQLVLYGVGRRPISPKAFTKLWPTLTCLKDALWSSRNLLVGKQVETTPQAVALVATEALGWYERKGASTPSEGSPTTPEVPAATA
ncbi:uncharacterized protein LOC115184233 [Salmo trutta]|uniref:uncharacterized protein LOC115184233 n=1 Tax=Salmo trutta TaxID=8032 RepID=UPI0011320A29|nr:zinc finger CCHC domain-containing protein 3 [Salmo trutta]